MQACVRGPGQYKGPKMCTGGTCLKKQAKLSSHPCKAHFRTLGPAGHILQDGICAQPTMRSRSICSGQRRSCPFHTLHNKRTRTLDMSTPIKYVCFITSLSSMTPVAAGMDCSQAPVESRGSRMGQAQHPPLPKAHRAQASTPLSAAMHH